MRGLNVAENLSLVLSAGRLLTLLQREILEARALPPSPLAVDLNAHFPNAPPFRRCANHDVDCAGGRAEEDSRTAPLLHELNPSLCPKCLPYFHSLPPGLTSPGRSNGFPLPRLPERV